MEAMPTPVPVESKEFWHHHHQMQKVSGSSRADYCRQHELHYNRFCYWIKKILCKKSESNKLVSIKIKATNEPVRESVLCRLTLQGGHCLDIHDLKALSIILDKMR